jgi:hypothetical protein
VAVLEHTPQRDDGDVVAVVRVRERRGSAIGVCDVPPALELGASAEEVLERIKARLRGLVPSVLPPRKQWIVVVQERDDLEDIDAELLR